MRVEYFSCTSCGGLVRQSFTGDGETRRQPDVIWVVDPPTPCRHPWWDDSGSRFELVPSATALAMIARATNSQAEAFSAQIVAQSRFMEAALYIAHGRYLEKVEIAALTAALQSTCDAWLSDLSNVEGQAAFRDVCTEFSIRGVELSAEVIHPRLEQLADRVGSRFLDNSGPEYAVAEAAYSGPGQIGAD